MMKGNTMNSPRYQYEQYIRTIEDYPKPGIRFYDMAPLIGNGAVFSALIMDMTEPLEGKISKVVGFDARGFVFGGAVARELGVGFTMLRKAGKLPGETYTVEYGLEYGTDSLEIQPDMLDVGDEVLLIDDVIATGGTVGAGIELVRKCGARVVEFCALVDLPDFGGSAQIKEAGVPVRTFVSYGGGE